MGLVHSKNTIGLVQVGRGRQINILISKWDYSGSKGSEGVNHKGKEIETAIRSQGMLMVDFEGYVNNSDAIYLTSQAFIDGVPVTFSAIELDKVYIRSDGRITQRVNPDFINARKGIKGILFRSYGILDETKITGEAGAFIIIKCKLRASEFYPGKLLLS